MSATTMPPEAKKAYDEALRRIIKCKRDHWKALNLADLGLTALPPELFQLSGLTVLNLDKNRLTSLPPEVGQLSALTQLHLFDNQLNSLPPEIGQLSVLTVLVLDNNQFTSLPPEINQLSALTKLILSNNQLTSLPPEIVQLSALTELDLSDNQLTSLPPQIVQLSALNEIYLTNNKFTSLPEEICQFAELQVLRLEFNALTTLPPEIGQLLTLKELYLDNNRLTTLPQEIGQLSALKELRLSNNPFTTLPPVVGRLSALRILDLHNIPLTTLPPELGRLTALTELFLDDNQLTTLPQELSQLYALKELSLHGNHGLGLPPEVLGPTWDEVRMSDAKPASPKAVLDYYFAREQQGEEPMQEVRLLMVGRGRVGKTSLLKVLRGGAFNQKEAETLGITVMALDLNCSQGTVRAHAWDFGGQEFLHGTHQIFLSERCVYVLVLEGREGNWEVETDYWLRFIQSYGGDSPVIVALNKHDEHAFSVDRFRLQERCPQIVGFVETDAFTGRDIPELRALLDQTVNGMKDVWLGVPKKWHRIKEALTAMPESFVCYADYQALCAREGVTEERQQDSLAETLHRLGIALNFRDHHRLRQTSVLKPQWVTEGIYGLLRYAQSQECHGVLEQAMIAKALPAKEYPPSTHEFVMELMEKFEVAFPLESADNQDPPTRWLIPELLPEVQPAPFTEFRGVNVKRLRFSYPEALPPGLLPRLIVRTHEMSAAHPDWRWRSGVVLEWNGCQALVRLDRSQRRTTVEVLDCPPETQQSLFDLIRDELEVLHGKVPVVETLELSGHPDTWVSARKLRLLEDHKTAETLEETKEKELTVVKVTPTLNEVESQEARDASKPDAPKRLRLFVSYAHADARKIKSLGTHLKILGRRGYIQVWDDKQLVAGEEWEERIMAEMEQADIVLLIYSTASRASDFIQDKEGPLAVKLSQAKACRLIVVPLDRKDWDDQAPLEKDLKKLQTASWNARPVLDFTPQSKGWEEVEQAIRKVVETLRKLRD